MYEKTVGNNDPILLVSNEDLFFDLLYGTSGIRNQFQKILCVNPNKKKKKIHKRFVSKSP